MHGIPPGDFPKAELAEFFRLHSQLGGGQIPDRESLQKRHSRLEAKLRNWPRTVDNDPYNAASLDLADRIQAISGYEVLVGYNEFCAPSMAEALETAAARGAERIVVLTPMMSRGGQHSEKDIPAEIEAFRSVNKDVRIDYAWPFDPARVARFLSEHLAEFA